MVRRSMFRRPRSAGFARPLGLAVRVRTRRRRGLSWRRDGVDAKLLVVNDDLEPIDLSDAASAERGPTRHRSTFRVGRRGRQVALAVLVAAVIGVTGAA